MAGLGAASAADDVADGQRRRGLRVRLPAEERIARRRVAGREKGVRGDDAREAIFVLGGVGDVAAMLDERSQDFQVRIVLVVQEVRHSGAW